MAEQEKCRAQLETLPAEMVRREDEVVRLGAIYRAQGREQKAHSQMAKARRRLAAAQKKFDKAPSALKQAQQAAAMHRQRLEQLRGAQTAPTQHLEQQRAEVTVRVAANTNAWVVSETEDLLARFDLALSQLRLGRWDVPPHPLLEEAARTHRLHLAQQAVTVQMWSRPCII